MKPTDDYLTKREFVEYMDTFKAELTVHLGNIVGEIVGDAMQLISKRFDELQLSMDKSDYRLSSTVGQVDGHEVRLRRLEA